MSDYYQFRDETGTPIDYYQLVDDNNNLCKEVKQLQQENQQLKEDKKKAKKYIDEKVLFEDMFGEGEDTFLEDVNTKYYKGLKEILGDKENE